MISKNILFRIAGSIKMILIKILKLWIKWVSYYLKNLKIGEKIGNLLNGCKIKKKKGKRKLIKEKESERKDKKKKVLRDHNLNKIKRQNKK